MATFARAYALQRLCAARGSRPFLGVSLTSAWRTSGKFKTRCFHSGSKQGSQDVTHCWTPQQKRILYHSKQHTTLPTKNGLEFFGWVHACLQRGWVELDLILSAFSERRIGTLSSEELSELERILNEENVVLYGCLVGNNGVYDAPPEHIGNLKLFQQLQEFVAKEYPRLVATVAEKGASQP
ncbi:hypothetical protein Emag_004233 [Eimeria magna]